ncbi:MAG: magnesium/cobalt transporter CorA [Bdellovibrionales bacterium]
MISLFTFEGNFLKYFSGAAPVPKGVPVWIDLLQPDEAEIAQVERDYGIDLPTLEHMREIETSSRLYEEGDAFFMTFSYVSDSLGEHPETTPLTFVLKDNVLVTVRYKHMRIITHFIERAQSRGVAGKGNCANLVVLLLENIIDLCADALEKGHSEIEVESQRLFAHPDSKKDYTKSLKQIAQIGNLNSKMRESLVGLSRLEIFLEHAFEKTKTPKETISKLKTLSADIHSLLDHSNFISGKITFLLDATLGLLNIEQNAIIKIFSVAAVIFLPPTLVASIYGMNFRHLPELDWLLGYPMALVFMAVSAVMPYLWFKKRGWL